MHVSARAVGGTGIFQLPMACRQYLKLLARAGERYGVKLLFFVIMANHVHLLVWGPSDRISRAIQYAHGRFALWVNEASAGQGHVFQARFDGRVVRTTSYLVSLLRYLARNPVSAEVAATPGEYPWSADRYFRSERPSSIVDVAAARKLTSRASDPLAYARLVDGRARAESTLQRLRRELLQTALALGLTTDSLRRGREPAALEARRRLIKAWLAAGVTSLQVAKVLGITSNAVNRQVRPRQ